MGEVKEAVKGSAPPPASNPALGGNILQQLQGLTDEVSRLTSIKDNDVMTEGDAAKPENTRKAGTLRAVASLLRASKTLLEDY